tara:strand:- start:1018 stop:1401 length:384 start_codon:yes stop_codon:yes gene_type:complete
MELRQRILVTIIIGAVLIGGFFLVTEAITKYTGFAATPESDKNNINSCLDEKDITLYVNTHNLAETLKKIELEDYLDSVYIINCARNNQVCLEKNIDSFPFWIIEGNVFEGEIDLNKLAKLSECHLV